MSCEVCRLGEVSFPMIAGAGVQLSLVHSTRGRMRRFFTDDIGAGESSAPGEVFFHGQRRLDSCTPLLYNARAAKADNMKRTELLYTMLPYSEAVIRLIELLIVICHS